MDAVRLWLLEQGLALVIGVLFLVAAAITAGLWNAADRIGQSKLNAVARIMLCVPIIVVGWCLIAGLIGLFFREAVIGACRELKITNIITKRCGARQWLH